MLVDEPEKVMMLGFVLVFPLTFASSAFVPVATMPGWMQAWAAVNPATLLVDAVRGLLVGGRGRRPGPGRAGLGGRYRGGVRSAGPAGVPAAELTSAAAPGPAVSAASTLLARPRGPAPVGQGKPRSPSAARAASRTRTHVDVGLVGHAP